MSSRVLAEVWESLTLEIRAIAAKLTDNFNACTNNDCDIDVEISGYYWHAPRKDAGGSL